MSYGSGKMWPDSNPRTWLETNGDAAVAAFDSSDAAQLPSVVKRVNKPYVSVVNNGEYSIGVSADKYWCPSMTELGYSGGSIPVEGSKYEAFATKASTSDKLESAMFLSSYFLTRTTTTTGTGTSSYIFKSREASSNSKSTNAYTYPMLCFCI